MAACCVVMDWIRDGDGEGLTAEDINIMALVRLGTFMLECEDLIEARVGEVALRGAGREVEASTLLVVRVVLTAVHDVSVLCGCGILGLCLIGELIDSGVNGKRGWGVARVVVKLGRRTLGVFLAGALLDSLDGACTA